MSDTAAYVITAIVLSFFAYASWSYRERYRAANAAILSAISDLERLNEVLSAGIADRVRVREIIEKLKGAVE